MDPGLRAQGQGRKEAGLPPLDSTLPNNPRSNSPFPTLCPSVPALISSSNAVHLRRFLSLWVRFGYACAGLGIDALAERFSTDIGHSQSGSQSEDE